MWTLDWLDLSLKKHPVKICLHPCRGALKNGQFLSITIENMTGILLIT